MKSRTKVRIRKFWNQLLVLSGCLFLSGAAFAGKESKAAEAANTDCFQYNVGSISKTFTAVAVMKLVEEGKVELDAPVTKYVPEFTMQDARYRNITVRMLLNHSSGMMGSLYHNGIILEDGIAECRDGLLPELAGQKLKADPGSYEVYTNDGFVLAEILVEHVTGKTFTEYLEQEIFAPLGMEDTGTSLSAVPASVPHAKTYQDQAIELPYEGATEVGSGGIRSTTEDLCRLAEVFMEKGNAFLSPSSVEEMKKDYHTSTTVLMEEGAPGISTGLGLDYVELSCFSKYGIQAIGKGGDLAYQHGSFIILPEKNMSAAVLSSGGSSTFDQLVAQAVLLSALEVEGEIPEGASEKSELEQLAQEYEQKEACEMPEEYRAFAGIYSGGNTVKISFPDSKTMLAETVDEDSPVSLSLHYAADGWFYGDRSAYFGSKLEKVSSKLGISKVRLVKEEDGGYYLYNSACGYDRGLGSSHYSSVYGRKLEENIGSEKVQKAWKARMGKKYYVYNDRYSSEFFLNPDTVSGEIHSVGVDGYYRMGSNLDVQKIESGTHASSACIGRDMSTQTIFYQNGAEFLSLDDGGSIYISEDAIPALTTAKMQFMASGKREAQWYKIPEKLSGEKISISIKGKGAVYLYDRYDRVTDTTLSLNGTNHFMLPEEGKLVFAGEAGSSAKMVPENN